MKRVQLQNRKREGLRSGVGGASWNNLSTARKGVHKAIGGRYLAVRARPVLLGVGAVE